MVEKYYGKICQRHPALKGLRRKSNWNCVGCETMRALERRSFKARQIPGTNRFRGKTCAKHPKEKGERYIASGRCVGCHRVKVKAHPNHAGRKREHVGMRHRRKKLVTPKWVKPGEIVAVYAKAKKMGLTVDHVIPLRHPLVSGLHCPANFKLVSLKTNVKKGNKFEPG